MAEATARVFDPLVPSLGPKTSTWLPGEPADPWVWFLEAEASRNLPPSWPRPPAWLPRPGAEAPFEEAAK
jgi:hypothetical protein